MLSLIFDDNWRVMKIVSAWNDVLKIVRKQKGAQKLDAKIKIQLDRLFDLVKCQCLIGCVDEDGKKY